MSIKSKLKCTIHKEAFTYYCLKCYQLKCNNCKDLHNSYWISLQLHKQLSRYGRINIPLKLYKFITNLNSPYTNQPLIHFFKQKLLVLYNPSSKQFTSMEMDNQVYPESESICFFGSIYIIGDLYLSGKVYRVDIHKKTLIPKQKMLVPTFIISLCSNINCIFSIGGDFEEKDQSPCQKYIVQKNVWEMLPYMITQRKGCASFCFLNSYIYAFGGHSNKTSKDLDSIERLSLLNPCAWVEIAMRNKILERECAHAIQTTAGETIIFGGFSSTKCFGDCHCVKLDDSKKAERIKVANMHSKCSFHSCSAPIIIDGIVYAMDENGDLHIYSNQCWSLVNKPQ